MTVRPVPFEAGRYWVTSRSRKGLEHLVDLNFQNDEHDPPHPECFCEGFAANPHTKGLICEHITATLEYVRQQEMLK